METKPRNGEIHTVKAHILSPPPSEVCPKAFVPRTMATYCAVVLLTSSQIVRACRDRDRALIFRGWSRLRLHVASRFATEGAPSAPPPETRAARVETFANKVEVPPGTAESSGKPTAATKDGESETRAANATVSAALQKAEAAEWALRKQGGWLVRRISCR